MSDTPKRIVVNPLETPDLTPEQLMAIVLESLAPTVHWLHRHSKEHPSLDDEKLDIAAKVSRILASLAHRAASDTDDPSKLSLAELRKRVGRKP